MGLKELDVAPPQHVIEAAIIVLGDAFEIDDPGDVAQRLLAIVGGDVDAAGLEKDLREAANSAASDVVALVKLVLAVDEPSIASQARVRSAVEMAGRKQLVVTPEMVYYCAALAVYAVAMLRNPKKSSEETITIEDDPKGRKKIVIKKAETYLDPFSPLAKVIERILKG